MEYLFTAQKICKSYSGMPVLFDVDVELAAGETMAIIGPNGAGKTTLFKVLTGEGFANVGRITYRGDDITDLPAFERVTRGFGRTFQVARVLPNDTVKQNLIIALEAHQRRIGQSPRWYQIEPKSYVVEEAAQAALSVGLDDKLNVEAKNLSHGDKKRLEMAAMLCLKPQLLMLDEPTAGMSPPDRRQIVDLIRAMKAKYQLTLMLTEHDMDVVFGLADRIMVMNMGRVVACDKPEVIRNSAEVRDVYLGSEGTN